MTDDGPSGDDGPTVSYDLGDRAAPHGVEADEADAADLGPASSAASSSAWPASASSSGWRRARPRHVPRHRRAFHRFYREHFGLVWSMVRRFGVPAAHHEDAVQEVWLVAYRRLHTLEPEASAKAWLSTITRRVASRLRRTEHRKARKLAALHLAGERTRGSSSSSVEAQDARRLLAALLAVLDEEQRDVLVLAQVHGLSGPEIAEALEIPLNTAYSRLRLARRRVDRFVAEVGTEQALVIGALRRSEEPPPRAAMGVWAVLVPQLGLSGAGAAASSGAPGGIAGVKAFAIAAVVGVVGLVTARAVVDARAVAKRERAAIVVDAADGGGQAPAPGEAEPSRVDVDRAAPPATSAAPSATTPVPAREPAASDWARSSNASTSSSKISASSRTAAASPRDAVEAGSASMLTAEAELLGRAQQALREGDAAAALRLLEEHERRFPAGELGDARRGARVRALCGLGRGAQARAEASSLLRERPHSPVAAGVADVCS